MARLVTSDGVQVNLFLDLDSNNTGEGTLLYGPKSQPNMDFIVQGFKDFRTNTEFNNKNRLVFHCDHQITVYISSIMGGNYPTSSSQYTVPGHSDTKLYYVGNDLVLSKTGTKIHRIDLFKSASTNIDDLEDSMFDGNYNSLTNKPTIPSDVNQLNDADGILDTYTKSQVDNLVKGTGEQPGNNYVHVESQTISTGIGGNYPQYVIGWNTLSFNDLFPSLTENAIYLVTCYILWIPQNPGHSVYFRSPYPNGVADNSTPYTAVIDPNDSALLMRSPSSGGSMMFTLIAKRENANSVAIKYWPSQAASNCYLTFTSSHCLKIG